MTPETPRTDWACKTLDTFDEMADHARKLERELAALQARKEPTQRQLNDGVRTFLRVRIGMRDADAVYEIYRALYAAPQTPEDTACWRCSKRYGITEAKCPHCGATNATVDLATAEAECAAQTPEER